MQRVEAVDVDGAAALLRDLAREVDREAERVVQEERVVAADVAFGDDAVEQVEAARERLAEALLLAAHDADARARAGCTISGYAAAHHVDGRVDQRGRDELARRRAGTRGAPRGG